MSATFVPIGNAKISTSAYKMGTSSAYFDGTGDYLTAQDSESWALSNNNFTIDFWFNPSSFGSYRGLISQQTNHNSNHSFSVFLNGNTGIEFDISLTGNSGINAIVSTAVTFSSGTWYHYAAVRNGTTITMYIDGVSRGTYNIGTNSIYNSTALLKIGSGALAGGTDWHGYIDQVRFSNGIARWTSDFTPDTTPYTPDPYDVILLHFEGDNNSLNFYNSAKTIALCLIANGNAVTSTTQKKLGNTSLYLDGNGDYLTVSSPITELDFGASDWTIEWFEYRTGQSDTESTITTRDGSDWRMIINYDNSGVASRHYFQCTDSTTVSWNYKNSRPSANSWVHYAVVRHGTHIYTYVDGTRVDDNTSIGTKAITPPTDFRIGRHYANSDSINFEGYIDEMRISKGIARFTGTTLTVPQAPYTSDQYDIVLLHGEGDNNAFNIVNSIQVVAPQFKAYGNAVTSTNQSKFGTASLYSDGNGDYIYGGSNCLDFGKNNWTIEWWEYRLSNGDAESPIAITTTNSSKYPMILFTEGLSVTQIYFTFADSTTTSANVKNSIPTINQWVHVAIERHGSNINTFENGTRINQMTSVTKAIMPTGIFKIFRRWNNNDSNAFHGYMDEIRVSRDIARYQGNNFTPSTIQYISDPYDVVLLHGEGDNNGTLIENSAGSLLISISQTNPSDNSYIFTPSQDLILTFDQDVTASTGNIVIYNASDDSVFQTIAASNTTINGAQVTVAHNNFTVGQDYYVLIDSTAFLNFPGISNKTLWNWGVRTQFSKTLTNTFNFIGNMAKGKVAVKWGTGLKWGGGTKWGQIQSYTEYFKTLVTNLKMGNLKKSDINKYSTTFLRITNTKLSNITKSITTNLKLGNLLNKVLGGTVYFKTLVNNLKFINNEDRFELSESFTVNTSNESIKFSFPIGNDKVVEFYNKIDNYIYAKIGTLSNGIITYGNEQLLLNTNNYLSFKITNMTNDKFIIGYVKTDSTKLLSYVTISNDIISVINTITTVQPIVGLLGLNSTQFILGNSTTDFYLYTIENNVITFKDNETGPIVLDANYLLTKITDSKFMLWGRKDSDYKLYAQIFDISNNLIVMGSSIKLSDEIIYIAVGTGLNGFDGINIGSDKVIICYTESADSTKKLKTKILGIDGNIISVINTLTVNTENYEKLYNSITNLNDINLYYSFNNKIYLSNISILDYSLIKTGQLVSNNSITLLDAFSINNTTDYFSYEDNNADTYGKTLIIEKNIYDLIIKNANKYVNLGLKLNNRIIRNISKLVSNKINIIGLRISNITKSINNNIKIIENKTSNITKNLITNLNLSNLFNIYNIYNKIITTTLKMNNTKLVNVSKNILNNLTINNLMTKTKNLLKGITTNLNLTANKLVDVSKNIRTNLTLESLIIRGSVFIKNIVNSLNLSNLKNTSITKTITNNFNILNLKIVEVNKFINISLNLSANYQKWNIWAKNITTNLRLNNLKNISIAKNVINNLNFINNKLINITKSIINSIKFISFRNLNFAKTITNTLNFTNSKILQVNKFLNTNLTFNNLKNITIVKNVINTLNLINSKIVEVNKFINNNLTFNNLKNITIAKIMNINLKFTNSKTVNISKIVISKLNVAFLIKRDIAKIINNTLNLLNIKILQVNKFLNTTLNLSNLYEYHNAFKKLITNNLNFNNSIKRDITKIITNKMNWVYNLTKRLWNSNSESFERIKSRFKNPKEPQSRLTINEPKTRWNPWLYIKSRNKK